MLAPQRTRSDEVAAVAAADHNWYFDLHPMCAGKADVVAASVAGDAVVADDDERIVRGLRFDDKDVAKCDRCGVLDAGDLLWVGVGALVRAASLLRRST